MKPHPRLIFVGYTNIDVNIFPHGKTVLPGGGAYFAAIAASRIIQPVGLITRIGKEYDAKFLLSRVLSLGVHQISDKPTATSTQTYHSETDPTDRDISLEWGVAPDICPEDFPPSWLKNSKYIHIATMPPNQQAKFILFLRKKAPQALLSIDTDIFFFKNPKTKAAIEKNFSMVDIVFANRREYEGLKPVIDTAPQAIIKLDKEGAYYMKRGKVLHKTSAKSAVSVDPTGAGDIFAGTFLAMRTLDKSIYEALKEATKTATVSVTQIGVDHLFEAVRN